jgi:hypothetical protein
VSKRWIRGAIGRRGGLHGALGVPLNRRIPARMLEAAARVPGRLGRQARLALKLRTFRRRR